METVRDFNFLGSKIIADGDCSHETKWLLLLGRKAMTNLDSILKSRGIALPTKVPIVKAMVFPVVMYECESRTIKKAEHQRTDAFELWCWRRLFKSPLDSKEIKPVNLKENQSWIFIGGTDNEAEAPGRWPPDVKNWLIRKAPDAGKAWRQEEKGRTEDEMVGWYHGLNGHDLEQAPEDVKDRKAWHAAVHGVTKSRKQPRDWTTTSSQVAKVLESATASVLPMNSQGWFPLGLTGLISLQSKGLSRVFSNTTVQKHQFFGAQPSLWSYSHIHTWLLEKL